VKNVVKQMNDGMIEPAKAQQDMEKILGPKLKGLSDKFAKLLAGDDIE